MPLGAQLNVHSRSRRSSLLRGKERNANTPQAELPSLTRQAAQVSLLAAPLVRQGAHADLHSPERKTDKNRKQDASPGAASPHKFASPKETRRRKSSARSSKKFAPDHLSAWDEDKHHARMLACHTVSEMQRYYEQLIAMRPGQFKFAFEVQMKMIAKEKEATPAMSPPRIKPAHYSVASAFVRQRHQAISDARRAKQATATSSLTTSATSTTTQPTATLSRTDSFSASNTLMSCASTLPRTPCTPSVTATTTTTNANPIVLITPCSPPRTPASPSLAPGSLSPLSPCSSLTSASPSTPSLDSPTQTPASRAKISPRTIPARPRFASPTQTSSTTSSSSSSSSTTPCTLTTLGDRFASVSLSPRTLSHPSSSSTTTSRAKISPSTEHKKASISSSRAQSQTTKTSPAADGAIRTTSFVAPSSITPTSHSRTNASQTQQAALPSISLTLPRTFRTDRPALPQRPPPSRPRMPGREPPKRPPKLSAADVALPNTQPVTNLATQQSASTTIHLNDTPSTHVQSINNTLPSRGKRGGVPELKLGQDLQTSTKSLDVRAAILPLSPSNRARKSSTSHPCSSFATDKENDAATPRAKQKR